MTWAAARTSGCAVRFGEPGCGNRDERDLTLATQLGDGDQSFRHRKVDHHVDRPIEQPLDADSDRADPGHIACVASLGGRVLILDGTRHRQLGVSMGQCDNSLPHAAARTVYRDFDGFRHAGFRVTARFLSLMFFCASCLPSSISARTVALSSTQSRLFNASLVGAPPI